MRLRHGLHLAYCTNIHRGEDWSETFAALERYTLAVRDGVCPGKPYGIGLRLSDLASRQLAEPGALRSFRSWLQAHGCYVFTINGFPYGPFHGTRVKEQVYVPDWTTPERVAFTNRLVDILAALLPEGMPGSVSTLPGSFKEFITTGRQVAAMRANLWQCVEHLAAVSERTGHDLHLGLEPEPLCFLETSRETLAFLADMRNDRPGDERLARHLGVNYDTCHLAVEYETPPEALTQFRNSRVRVSKIHLSSALQVRPTRAVREALSAFADHTYLHQVIARSPDGTMRRYRDLDVALAAGDSLSDLETVEWRIHFHIPLHRAPAPLFGSTRDHLLGVLDFLQRHPDLCSHLEMETYTWEVMPPEMKNRQVVDQLVSEYQWTLAELAKRGFDRLD
jgi:hypothetical protein